jgi:hypothetical protein
MLILLAWSFVASIPKSAAHAAQSAHAQDVYAFGDAPFLGSTGSLALTKPIVGMAATPSGRGYWSVASDGGIFSFGDARFYGSTGAIHLNRPIVGMTSSPTGHGYWLVASDGGIFSFGDARFYGSTGGMRLNRPIVGMAPTSSGRGYWFVATDGGIFAFGDARYHGSMGGTALAQPVVSMDATPTGNGYVLAAADGGVFAFGDAMLPHPATATAVALAGSQHVIDVAVSPVGQGYWLASARSAKADAAVAWYMSRVGQSVYTGQCELAIENAFGTESVYATAASDWQAQPIKHLDWQNAPRGSAVFWNTGPSGHVAISLGDGLIASTSVDGHIGVVPIGYFQNPLGWVDSPFH